MRVCYIYENNNRFGWKNTYGIGINCPMMFVCSEVWNFFFLFLSLPLTALDKKKIRLIPKKICVGYSWKGGKLKTEIWNYETSLIGPLGWLQGGWRQKSGFMLPKASVCCLKISEEYSYILFVYLSPDFLVKWSILHV